MNAKLLLAGIAVGWLLMGVAMRYRPALHYQVVGTEMGVIRLERRTGKAWRLINQTGGAQWQPVRDEAGRAR